MKKTIRILNDESWERIEDEARNITKPLIDCAWNCGYRVKNPYYRNGKLIMQLESNGFNRYTPEIKIVNEDEFSGIKEFCVKISPVKNEIFNTNDYNLFCKAQNKALQIANEIEERKVMESEKGEFFPIVVTEEEEKCENVSK